MLRRVRAARPFPDFKARIQSSDSLVSVSRSFGCPSHPTYLVARAEQDGAFAARELDGLDRAVRRDVARRVRQLADQLRALARRIAG